MKNVILLNFGGPVSLSEVRGFLRDIYQDVLPGPLKRMAGLFARLREPRSKMMYEAIGGSSPVVSWTKRQAELLERELPGTRVHVAMLYGRPRMDQALAEAKKDGAKEAKVVQLYCHPRGFKRGSQERNYIREVPAFAGMTGCESLYVQLLTDIIMRSLTPGATILFSAHAVPNSYVKKGSPYLKDIYETASRVMKNFTGVDHRIAFQSAALPFGWTAPTLRKILKELARGRVQKKVLIVPLGFACENVETLYEIDKVYMPCGRKLGLDMTRAPCPNDHPLFIKLLANQATM